MPARWACFILSNKFFLKSSQVKIGYGKDKKVC